MNFRKSYKALLGALAIGAGLLPFARQALAAETPGVKPPNVIIILADDLGYADLGIQGSKEVPTPNIDSIAQNGARFSAGYASCPICAPTRAGLITGRYQQRFGFDDHAGAKDVQFGLEVSEKTIADSFKAAGYATAAFGKWHLGEDPAFHPNNRGFDEFLGFLGGANSFLYHSDDTDDSKAWDSSLKSGPTKRFINGRREAILRQQEIVSEPEYLTDAFAREGASFIERQANAGKPFLLYVPFNAIHVPLEATDKYLARFPDIKEFGPKAHAAMVSALDDGVGTILRKLREKNLEENTIIFFLSDNGGPTSNLPGGGNYSLNTPLRGRKGTFFEGGIRVPFFVQWKGHIPAGKTLDQPVISLDIVPTALAAANVKPAGAKPLDGKNLLPLARGESAQAPHDLLFWRYHAHFAARDSQWKLIKIQGKEPQLFNLTSDISETTNVAKDHPEIVARLSKSIDEWNNGNEKPRWIRTVTGPDGKEFPQPAPVGREFKPGDRL